MVGADAPAMETEHERHDASDDFTHTGREGGDAPLPPRGFGVVGVVGVGCMC
jgi:hypothetical protein